MQWQTVEGNEDKEEGHVDDELSEFWIWLAWLFKLITQLYKPVSKSR